MGNKQSGSGTDVKLVIEDSEIDYEFSPEDTVSDLKSLVQENFEIPIKKQEVMLAEDVLKDGKTLAEYEIQPGDTIYIYDIRKDKTRKRGERKARIPKPAPKKDNKKKSKGGRFKKEESEEEEQPEEQDEGREPEQEEEEEVEEEKPKKKSAVNKEPIKKEAPKKEEPKKEPPKKGQRGKKEEPKKEEPKKDDKKGKKEEKKEVEDEMKYKGLVVLGPEDVEFSIDFNDDTKVQEVADIIVTEFDIPTKFQEIYFKDTKLANKQMLAKVGVKSNDEIKVKDIRFVDVTLKIGKQELNGHFQKTTKIQKIMEYVEKEYNIPFDSQDVYYNEKYAESSATLQKLKVVDGTSIMIYDLREDEDGDGDDKQDEEKEEEGEEQPEPEPEPEPVKKDTKKKADDKKPVTKPEQKTVETKKTDQPKAAPPATKPAAKPVSKPTPPPQKIDEDDDEEEDESEEEKPQAKPAPPPAPKVVTPAIPPVQPKVAPRPTPPPAPATARPAAPSTTTKKTNESDDDEGDEDEGPFIDLKVDFDGNIIEVDFGLDERIFALKEFLSDDTNVPMESIEITYNGKVCPDQTLIEHLNVQPDTIIYAKDTRKQ